jgi:choline dehydrogenase-like flavoprotein
VAERHRTEVLVVGSGPGGAATASTLASAGKDVIVLEEGPRLELESCSPFTIEEMAQKYRSGGLTMAIGAPKIPFVEGCCVGGGSEINSGLYHRTPSDVLADWRERFRVEHIGDADLLPHFQACEEDLSVQLNPGEASSISLKMKLGADRLGWKSLEVPRWFKYDAGPDGRTSGTRQSMTKTMIPRALASSCKLMPGVRATRLTREKGRWLVMAERGGESVSFDADSVFVCGGAIQSPALLRRSGILRNIGNSLALHPTVKVTAMFDEEVRGDAPEVAAHQVKEFAPEISMGCSITSLPYLALSMLDHPEAKVDLASQRRRMAIYYAMITGPTAGSIRNVPFSKAPIIRYPLSGGNMRSLAKALRLLCQLVFAAGATAAYPSVRGLGCMRSDDDLSRIPGELPRAHTNLMTIHLFSSCPMGESAQCAVDSFGRVHGHENLFVNDASILCTAPGVNPQGTVMALARRNALHFLKAL